MISTEEAVFSHQHSDMPRPNSLRLQTSPEEMDDVFGGVLNCDMTEDNGNFESNSISDIESTDSRDWSLDNAKDDSNSNSMSEYLRDLVLDRDEEDATVADLVVGTTEDSDQLMESSHQNRMRIALGIILRLVLPLANGLARGLKGIRDVRFLRALRNLISSRQALTNAMAYAANTISMGLSSVQVSHRIDPLLKMMKLKRCEGVIESIPDGTTPLRTPLTPEPRIGFSIPSLMFENHEDAKAEKCCSIKILAEPPPGTPIRADIVLIHGLHGSLVNTWKQGLWCNNRGPEHFERPPKPEVRPPKRPRHSRSNIILPPHKEKRRRFADREHFSSIHHDSDDGGMAVDSNVFTYECGAPEEVRFCDGLEYSFPSFRLRLDKNSNFFDPDYESARTTNIKKPSVNDPNYSKCWPGDWLPIDCPGVRVIALNYTTDKYLWRPAWKQKEARSSLIERAREMTDLLVERKVGYGHPIVWVGHSKGGIFIKQIIVDAWESGRLATAPLWRSSRGTFFYSVPHRGSHLASIKAPFLRRSVELVDIEKNSKYLLDLHRRFVGLYQMGHLKIEVFSFVETALTLMSVLYLRIVGVDSADPGIGEVCGLHLDHREICKPRSRDCILYKELVKMIKKVC